MKKERYVFKMSRAIKRIVLPILILAILISSYVLPVSAATVTRWSHIEYTRFTSYSPSGNYIEEPIGYGYAIQNPETSEKHFGNNYWKVRVKTGIYQRMTMTINGNSVSSSDMGMKQISSGTERDGTQWVEYDYYIYNVPDYINPSNTRNTICFTSYNGSQSAVNYLHVLALRPGPAPTVVGYNALNHHITGLNYLMEFSYDGGNQWWGYSSGTNISHNIYPHLSKNYSTYLEVRFKETATAPASNSWKYTVSKLDPAPTGLFIDWVNNAPALLGLDATKYYAISNTTDFATYSYIDPGYTGVLLDSTLTAGKVIYVRSAASASPYAPSSAYVALTVPAKATPPAALYDKPSHTLYGLYNTMDFRLGFPDGYSSWMQITSNNAYFNAYPYADTSYDLKIDVRYRATPTAVQTITVPKLAQAPTGMELEWMDGVGLILWGLEQGRYYDFNTDAYFDSWYSCDGEYYGINITALGLVPGDSLFVRYAPNTSTYTSACVELIVPSMIAMSASAVDAPPATSGVTSAQVRTEISDEIADMQLDSIVIPEGQKIEIESDELSIVEANDNEQIAAHKSSAIVSNNEIVFGTLEEFMVESNNEPIISKDRAFTE